MQANMEPRSSMSSSFVYFYIVKHKTSKTSRILNSSTINSSGNLKVNPKKLINSQWDENQQKAIKEIFEFYSHQHIGSGPKMSFDDIKNKTNSIGMGEFFKF